MNVRNDLDIIFSKAKEVLEENKAEHQQFLKEQEQKEQEKETRHRSSRRDPKIECHSKELYELILQFGFTIDAYVKNTEEDEDLDIVYPTLETYYCSFGNWSFIINNLGDPDIDEGIFSLNSITHKETGEEVNFYCDLGCRNTSKQRRDEVLDFLRLSSLEEYASNKYALYLSLPMLLRENGYDVYEEDFRFELHNPKGYLKIGNDLFVKMFRGWYEDIKFVVTNDSTWNANSDNNSYYPHKKAYYFDYQSEKDIHELCKCIEAFKCEQEGKIGYYDSEKNRYYSNKDVLNFFNGLRDKDNYYKDAWNHYHIKIEHDKTWDKRGYDEEHSVVVNKYKGLELFVQTEMTFNDAAQWSIGNQINKSFITVELDKRKSKDCRLLIENYVYEDSMQEYDYDIDDYVIKEDCLVETIDTYGTFNEIMEILKTYVHTMIEIHGLDI